MYKASILIVEDNEIVLLELKDRLEALRYKVVSTASSGTDAIRKAGLYLPDLILMDIRIKGSMDGIDTATAIRKNMDIPIVFLTAHADDITLQRAKITEPYGYIIKPFEERELNTSLEMALYKHAIARKLKESEEYFRCIFEYASIGNALTSIDGKFIDVNGALCKMLGYLKEELISNNFNAFTHPDDNSISQDSFQELLSGVSESCEFEKRYIRKDGSIIWINLNSKLLRDSKSNPVHFITNFIDISERKLAEQKLQRSQQLLSLHIKQTPLAFIEFDIEGYVRKWNPSAANIFGYSAKEAIGQFWKFIVPEKLWSKMDDIWNDLINQLGNSRSCNVNVTKDSKEIICEWYNAPLVDPSGKTIGVASLIMDITEPTRTENELKEHMNEITRFNKLMIGRENKMIELKKEINELLEKAGKPKKYKINNV